MVGAVLNQYKRGRDYRLPLPDPSGACLTAQGGADYGVIDWVPTYLIVNRLLRTSFEIQLNE